MTGPTPRQRCDGPGICSPARSTSFSRGCTCSRSSRLRESSPVRGNSSRTRTQPIILGPGWFPILKFTDGWLVCVDTHSGRSPAPVFVWDTGAGYDLATVEPWFPSVGELALAIVEAYRSGGVDPDNLEPDFDRLPSSARRLEY